MGGRPARFQTIEQRNELKQLLDSGMTRIDIAKHFNCDKSVIFRELARGNYLDSTQGPYDPEIAQMRWEFTTGGKNSAPSFDTEKKMDVLAMMLEAGMTMEWIGERFGCSRFEVRDAITKGFLEYRKKYKALKKATEE